MKFRFSFLLLLFSFVGQSQHFIKTDTIVDMGIYKSYFNYSLEEPLYVTYHLYQGGGDCDRNKSHFEFKSCGVHTACDTDYHGSGYDKGHLANAEDFANDCGKDEKTFCYFNCVPQTVKLNRGIWKTWETKIRDLSQNQKLYIIAGNIYGSKTIGNKLAVPDYCYKIVVEPETKKVLYCLLFPNDDSRSVNFVSVEELKRKLGYELVF